LQVAFTAQFDLPAIAYRAPTLWRYREAIPLPEGASPVSMGEGFTPLLPLRLAGREIWVKADHLLPSGSYKDRGAAVLVSVAHALGVETVVEDSSGNAGAAIAAYGAHAGIACRIYVPASTSSTKTAQITAYGAALERVSGSREDTAQAVLAAAAHAYYASHVWNPFFLQGTKTFAYEVCEQLGWVAPDVVILPVGNGTLLLGAYLGLCDLREAGLIEHLPRLIGVQAATCAPLARAYARNASQPAVVQHKPTMAEGIAIPSPARGAEILEAVGDTGGSILAVKEADIKAAWRDMGRRGHYIEPTAAATIAGARRYLADLSSDVVVVTAFTGHGLKAGCKYPGSAAQ
jgi:threonine synthase